MKFKPFKKSQTVKVNIVRVEKPKPVLPQTTTATTKPEPQKPERSLSRVQPLTPVVDQGPKIESGSTPWLDKKDPAARLCRMADRACVGIDHYVSSGYYSGDLKRAKLTLTPEVTSRAKALDRQWERAGAHRVWSLGGTYDGRRSN